MLQEAEQVQAMWETNVVHESVARGTEAQLCLAVAFMARWGHAWAVCLAISFMSVALFVRQRSHVAKCVACWKFAWLLHSCLPPFYIYDTTVYQLSC